MLYIFLYYNNQNERKEKFVSMSTNVWEQKAIIAIFKTTATTTGQICSLLAMINHWDNKPL